MRVEDLGNWHFNTDTESGIIQILLSDDLVDYYIEAKKAIKAAGILEIQTDLNIISNIADRLLGLLTFDLGPVVVKIALVAFALYEFANRLKVTGYEVVRTPSVYGKAVFGKTILGKGGYEIEPKEIYS